MIVAELLQIGAEILKMMSKSDLKTNDYKYIGLYHDYCEMRSMGYKISAIYMLLSERYGVSESTAKRIIKRLSSEVKS